MHPWRKYIALALILLVSLLGTGLQAQDQKEPQPYPFVPGEVLVRFKPSVGVAAAAQIVPGAIEGKTFEIVPDLKLIRLPATVGVQEAVKLYAQHPNVLYAQPNYLHHTAQQQILLTPNDEYYSQMWALDNTGQNGGTPDADIDAPEAWNLSTGSSSVVVAVIDTGVDYNHTDLMSNMWRNTPDCNTNGVDDDSNGYVDDCYGIDTANNDSDPMDDQGHGTHVAGTIGAEGNNGIGVVGVNWAVQIMACKFLDALGFGSTADAIECLQYVRNMKVNKNVPVIATNNSWGGGPFEQALYDAIQEHMNAGILFIAAAGNDGTDNDVISHYPSNYFLPNVIAVAASDRNDTNVYNYGLRTVHVHAPGKDILSTLRNDQYGIGSGTSMATPHVTGLAALLKAHNPSRDWIAIRNLIFSGGDVKPALEGKTVFGRRINAFGSLSCSGTAVFGVLRPFAQLSSGGPTTVAVVNINCAAPAGALTVTINPGGTVITLVDNGVSPDLMANDGIYSGTWNVPDPPSGGICDFNTVTYTLNFSNGQSTTVQVGRTRGSYACTTPSSNWRTITGTNLNLGDDTWATVTPGFPVQFGTSSYSTIYVNANGLISFTNNTGLQYNNQQLPYSSFTTLVAPFWDDLYATGTNNVYWQALGSTPNRELVIEWRNIRPYACRNDTPAPTVTFQVVLFESTNTVLFNYQDVIFGGNCSGLDKGGSATVGVQVSTSDATQIGFNSQILSNNMTVQWSTVSPSCPDTDAIFRVERATGNVCADGSFSSPATDVAEYILVSEAVEPGDVVELDPYNPRQYRKAQSAYSSLVAGVISTRPGVILGARSQLEGQALLALVGRVPVKATTKNGPIHPGDLLTSASKPGYAMRCSETSKCEGAIIGKALEALNEGESVVLILVMR